MKRCSTCNRTYSDPNLSFCIEDGTPLTPVEDESTVVSPRESRTDNDWNAAPYQPPGSYVPPGTQVPRRRVWPWVVGILGAFILGIVVLSIAAVILAPRFLRARQTEPPIAVNSNEAENSNSTAPPANANVDTANANTNAANANVDTSPPPSDHEQVLAQLTNLEHDWTVANLNADKQALDRILADDFVAPSGENNELQSKAEYIRTIRRNTDVEKWELDDLKLVLAGDRATLSGVITFVLGDDETSYDFKDKFVWRDGRWQATGSEVKPKE
jgi:hypothetical protein